MGRVRPAATALAAAAAFVALVGPGAAHVGGLTQTGVTAPVPTWLTVLTGGAVVGASFLLTSVVTERRTIRAVNAAGLPVPTPATLARAGRLVLAGIGLVALPFVVVLGLTGPTDALSNAAILLVWAGWWAGYTMTVYLLGNTWPALDPWRTIAGWLPSLDRTYPERLGAWPSVAGLIALVYVEVVTPVAEDPRLLAGLVLAYTAVTLAGAAVYGRATWFARVDPVARVFRAYGRIAPLQRDGEGRVTVRMPAGAIADDPASLDRGETAFVVALLWVTTYDGLVATPAWEAIATPVVDAGVPPLALYLVAILAGFALALAIYRLAAGAARRTADTYVTRRFLVGWFAPALLPIAAGYHVAHFLGYFLSLSPALLAVLASPLAPPVPEALVLPDWFAGAELGFVLLGHLLAVWIAHALAFELFPGTLAPLRSQYPLVVAMIVYTMTSAWIVSQPFGAPPFV